MRKVRDFVGSSSPVSVSENRGGFSYGVDNKDFKGKEARKLHFHNGASSSHKASFKSAMLGPVNDIPGSSKASRKIPSKHSKAESTARYKQVRPMGLKNRMLLIAGADGWHSQKLQKLGEVEGSLWHVQAELQGWKERLDSLMKIVDDGLGLISGLGFISRDMQRASVVQKGGWTGPTSSKPNKEDGPDRGPPMRSAIRNFFTVGFRAEKTQER